MLKFNYHHLYYFKVIATEGSVSKAADKLRLGQPTLSMQLKQFEEFLGQPLFERRNRSLQLTEIGRVVLNYSNEIFRLGDEMMDAIQDRPQEKKIRIQIGALESVPKSLIRALMQKAYSYGDCQISVFEGKGADLIQNLTEHQLDLVLSNTAPPILTEKKLFTRSLAKMQLIVCGAEKFKSLTTMFPHSLNGQPFILPTNECRMRMDFDRYVESQMLSVDIVAEAQDTMLMKTLALDGRGLIVVPEIAVRDLLKSKDLIKVGELFGCFEEIWLISAQRKLQNPIAARLMQEFSFGDLD
ncbi:MAG: LysR family transcriptional regulator [Oligoflexia bacterium]|nr:MAG: LysR family transcriptional regulator [Oligoflexia bacterium]